MAKKSEFQSKNDYIMLKNKNDVKELENFYVNSTIDTKNLQLLVEERKEEIVNKLVEFQNNYIQIKVDANGNQTKIVNPYLVSTYFFKSVNPLSNTEPLYSSEKLAIVWDIYMYLIEQVNLNITTFQPTLTHFAKFAGISLNTLKSYRNSGDREMQILIDKIYDETMDSNLTLAQNNRLKEKTTQFRLKVENEIVEKTTPTINYNVSAKVDLNKINQRLNEIMDFNQRTNK